MPEQRGRRRRRRRRAASPSLTTARQTWRRDAPSVRSSANSRMRWATVIEKVLKMMKAPTNSAMPANASSEGLQEAEVVADVLGLLGGLLLAGAHVDRRGRARARSCVLSCCGRRRPGLAATWISSKPSPLPSIRWASGSMRSSDRRAAERVEAGDLGRRRRACSTCAARSATAQTLSPSFQPCSSAVAASIAASSAFCGLRPVLEREALEARHVGDRGDEVRGAAAADALAVLAEDRAGVEDRALGVGHARLRGAPGRAPARGRSARCRRCWSCRSSCAA